MSQITKHIKEILIQLTVDDEISTDMTTLDEDIFIDALSTENLIAELRNRGVYIENLITVGVVNDALRNANEYRETEIVLTDDEKEDYFNQLQDELDTDESRINTIIEMVEKNILEDHEDED